MSLPVGAPLRQAMGETLVELGRERPSVVVVDADVGGSTGAAAFEAAHPERFVQAGIAEQNMVGVAAGLASAGLQPFVTSFACFVVGRAFDSIRVLVAQPALDVKILGGYAGLLTGRTGKTHQMFNDLAMMRSLRHMKVLAPADEYEMRAALRTLAEEPGPAYVQITREASRTVLSADHTFELGRAVQLRAGGDATLVSTGPQSGRTYEAAELLSARGFDVAVLHLGTVAPLDEAALVAAAAATGLIITVEEQDVRGGLGSAVAEVLAERHPVPVVRFGLHSFGESGSDDDLLDKYRLSPQRVAEDVEAVLRGSIGRVNR